MFEFKSEFISLNLKNLVGTSRVLAVRANCCSQIDLPNIIQFTKYFLTQINVSGGRKK